MINNTNIDVNTFILFNNFGFKYYTHSVYIACRYLEKNHNKINVENIRKQLNIIEKCDVPKHAITKSIKLLLKFGYLRKNKFNLLKITNQKKINNIHKKSLNKNFYESEIKLDFDCIKNFKNETEDENLYSYILSKLIPSFFENCIITYSELKNKFGVSRYNIKKCKSLFSQEERTTFNDSRLSAFIHTSYNIVTVGKSYICDELNKCKIKVSKYFNGALTSSDVYRSRVMTQVPFFTDRRKRFFTKLSENYLLSQMRKGKLILNNC